MIQKIVLSAILFFLAAVGCLALLLVIWSLGPL